MMRAKLLTVAALAVAALGNTATAQVETTADLEGVYSMTFDGAEDPEFGYPDLINPGGSSTVEIHAIDANTIQLVGFWHADATATATVDLDVMSLSIPQQTIAKTGISVNGLQVRVFTSVTFDWDFWYIPTSAPYQVLFDDDKKFTANGLWGATMTVNDQNVLRAYSNMKLTYESPLPNTAISETKSAVAVTGERWYTLDGRETVRPAGRDGQVYIVVRQLTDGTRETAKVRN